ncbi:programmed cell death protein 2 [Pholiota molesta]|nr:programmed cell death protein 2 [Pholiota molesta]
MPRSDDDWSDSDDEDLSQVETSVLLGVPDGDVDDEADRVDAAVSRIGGLPALLPSREPPISSSHCKSCSQPMELLVQMWCPFEDSPMDRALYIWGCARSGCQGKDGSVRAWRGLRINEKYAQKLAQKRQRQLARERERVKAEEAQAQLEAQRKNFTGGNPFSMGGKGAGNAPMFGLGAQIFGAPPSEEADESGKQKPKEEQGDAAEDKADNDDADDESTDEELLTALAATSISESAWKSAPSYPPLYLSTPRLPKGVQVEDLGDDDKKDKDISWAKETYEDSLEVDQVFERFMNRVKHEGEQCVRYELKGTPLPFGKDKIFDLLWPAPPQDPLPVTKPDFKVVRDQKRVYDASAVPKVFECQLVPNLINVLRPADEEKGKKLTDEERRKEVEKALKGGDKDAKRGMEWGTCMIFSCEKDCCEENGKEVKEAWREEAVYVQWDV